MRKILENIAHKTFVYLAIFALVLLNISGITHCSIMSAESCCHSQNLVKSCCVKQLKITADERITSNCGCSMKESPQNPDLYNDFSSYQSRSHVQNLQFIEPDYEVLSASYHTAFQINHSPPVSLTQDLYLANMNLRI